MIQEEKQLLLTDLCARLPYSPFVQLLEKFDDEDSEHFREIHNLSTYDIELFNSGEISNIKPYLRPLSSMTEEESVEYCDLQDKFLLSSQYPVTDGYALFDWLNKNMFDYRDLIPKGLAEIALEWMYVHETKLKFNESGSRIKVGCKIRSKTNPNIILSIISDDCHGDEFECSNGSVLSLRQINKYYDLI